MVQQDPLQWPTVKLLMSRISDDENQQKLYQGSVLHQYTSNMLSRCSSLVVSDLKKLDTKIRDRLAWSDTELLRSILAFLDTRSWAAPPKTTPAAEEGGIDSEIPDEVDDKSVIRAAMH